MNKLLTEKEIIKIHNLCFTNPPKACAIAQEIINICGIISCATYAEYKEKSTRSIQYKSKSLTGVKIEDRKFISLNQ